MAVGEISDTDSTSGDPHIVDVTPPSRRWQLVQHLVTDSTSGDPHIIDVTPPSRRWQLVQYLIQTAPVETHI